MMKAFEELTDDELTALSEATIQRYIDLFCAEEGIPLLPEQAPTAPNKRAIEPDQIGYLMSIWFVHERDAITIANKAAELPRVTKEYKSVPGKGYHSTYRFEPIASGSAVTVMPDKAYSLDQFAKCGEQIAEFESEKQQYADARAEYDKAVEQRQRASLKFRERIRAASSTINQRRRYQATFDRYLDLAEQNRRTACRFMVNTHPDAPDIIPDAFRPDEQGPIVIVGKRAYESEAESEADLL
jgi:hypothetical protein